VGERLLRNLITGIAGCCARAISGHVAASPSNAMNSRRLIVMHHGNSWRRRQDISSQSSSHWDVAPQSAEVREVSNGSRTVYRSHVCRASGDPPIPDGNLQRGSRQVCAKKAAPSNHNKGTQG
jgi:hypothetical protein